MGSKQKVWIERITPVITMMNTRNPRTWEVEAKRSGVVLFCFKIYLFMYFTYMDTLSVCVFTHQTTASVICKLPCEC